MAEPTPRYEFRAFGQGFGPIEDRIRGGRLCEDIAESREIYLLQAEHRDRNVKLRGGRLELKTLLEEIGGLQRWAPAGQWEFPVAARELAGTVFPELDSRLWGGPGESLDQEALLERVDQTGREVARAVLFKRRFRFVVQGCPAEIDEILVNGAAVRSVAVESEDSQRLKALVCEIGLTGYDNTAYPAALLRIMGLLPSSGASGHG
jgi:hypothetical protein